MLARGRPDRQVQGSPRARQGRGESSSRKVSMEATNGSRGAPDKADNEADNLASVDGENETSGKIMVNSRPPRVSLRDRLVMASLL